MFGYLYIMWTFWYIFFRTAAMNVELLYKQTSTLIYKLLHTPKLWKDYMYIDEQFDTSFYCCYY